jgi:hypothetical protein
MNNPSRTVAEAWAFRSFDIKRLNERTRAGVVYDDQILRDTTAKSMLKGTLDVAVPSWDIGSLQRSRQSIGIVNGLERNG